jgi:hypothetical protein
MASAEIIPPLPPFDEVTNSYLVDHWYFYYISKQIGSHHGPITRSHCVPIVGCNTTAISYCIYYKLIVQSRIIQPVIEIDHSHFAILPFSIGINIKQDSEWITGINRISQSSNKKLLNTMGNYLVFNGNSLYDFVDNPDYIRNGENIFLMYFVNTEHHDGDIYYISHYFVIVKLSEDEFVIISSYGSDNVQISLSVKKFRYEEWEMFVESFGAETVEERSTMGEFFKSYFLDRTNAVMPSVVDNPTPPASIEEGIEVELGLYIRERYRIVCVPNILDLLDISMARPFPVVPRGRQPTRNDRKIQRRSLRMKEYKKTGGRKTKQRRK